MLNLISLSLRRLDYDLLLAQDGVTASELMQEHVPQLVILDIAMPSPNGIELMRWMRSEGRFGNTKIMVFTSFPFRLTPDDVALADLVLAKPTTPRDLEKEVVALLNSGAKS